MLEFKLDHLKRSQEVDAGNCQESKRWNLLIAKSPKKMGISSVTKHAGVGNLLPCSHLNQDLTGSKERNMMSYLTSSNQVPCYTAVSPFEASALAQAVQVVARGGNASQEIKGELNVGGINLICESKGRRLTQSHLKSHRQRKTG
jgi:hypothetical protein